MAGFLKRLFGGGGDALRRGAKFEGRLEIDRPTYAIGDVHGRQDLLRRLLDRIEADARERGHDDWRLVLMGDYVDRGEDSAGVLREVAGLLAGEGPAAETVALRGNHEDMMLGFVAEPETEGPRWLRNGGLQALLSYGVGGISSTSDIDGMVAAGARLAEIAAPELAMMRGLPVWRRWGTVLFAHAGADPELPPELQSDQTLTWGTPRFFKAPRRDGLWCVHGHYVVDEAHAAQGRIAVDTGAYHSGVLSAVRLDGPEPGFLTT